MALRGAKSGDSGKGAKKGRKAAAAGATLGAYGRKLFLLSSLILLALAAAAMYWQYLEADKKVATQTREQADVLAARLSDQSRLYARLIEGVRKAPELIAAFRVGDKGLLQQQARRLEGVIPEAARVRLVLPDEVVPDTSEAPHLGFAGVDLIKLAIKTGKALPFEVHQDGEHAHVALVAAVPDANGKALGALHVAVPVSILASTLMDMNTHGVAVQLQQKLPGDKLRIVAESGSAQGAPAAVVPVANSIWQVAAWRSGSSSPMDLWLIPAVVIPALLLGGLVTRQVFGSLGKALTDDLGNLVRLNDQYHAGDGARRFPMHLRETDAALGLITKSMYSADSAKLKPVSPAAAATPAKPFGVLPEAEVTEPDAEPAELDVDLPEDLFDEEPMEEVMATVAHEPVHVPDTIFREYDIRGRVDSELSSETVYDIGRAIGSQAHSSGQETIAVARDSRASSPELAEALINGLVASGRNVIDLGLVPTPVLYFATHFMGANSGVMITGSHNPVEYNGLKVVIDGETLYGAGVRALKQRLDNGDLISGQGSRQSQDVTPDYIQRVSADVRLARPLNVVVDCGNGAAGELAPALLQALGCKVTELHCEVRDDFPAHHPDPSRPENLQDLIDTVQAVGADVGIAFDGDGDRLGVVDSTGTIIWPDRLLLMFARDVLSRMPGSDVVFDVKSTRALASDILRHGGRPVMAASGHSLLKAKMKETGAVLAGEFSGHIFFGDRWLGFDDALYAAGRLLELLSLDPRPSADVFAEIPDLVSTPELAVTMPEGIPRALVARIAKMAKFKGAQVLTIDGLRVEFEDGWGLVRASNTTPSLTLRFEAESESALERIQGVFREQISSVQPGIKLPF